MISTKTIIFLVFYNMFCYLVFGIVHPAHIDIPEPGLVPQHRQTIDEYSGVEHEPPACLIELLQGGG